MTGCRCDASHRGQPAAAPALTQRRATLLGLGGASAGGLLSWVAGVSPALADGESNCVEMPALKGKGYCKPATIYPGRSTRRAHPHCSHLHLVAVLRRQPVTRTLSQLVRCDGADAAALWGGSWRLTLTPTLTLTLTQVGHVGSADYVLTDSGLQYKDFRVGAGAAPQKGDRVVVDWDGSWTSHVPHSPLSLPFPYRVSGRLLPLLN